MATIELLFAPAHPSNPFEIAKREFIAKLARLEVPSIHVSPFPEEIEAAGEFLSGFARLGDDFLLACAKEVKRNSINNFSVASFEGVILDALEGYGLCEIQGSAEALREEYGEAELERSTVLVRAKSE